MKSISDVLKSIQSILDKMQPVVEDVSKSDWKPSDGFLVLMRRAIFRRQFDCLKAILHLVNDGRGYAGVPLLRPACEEWIWVKYFNSIEEKLAEELFTCMIGNEVEHSLEAQNEYLGAKAMKELGLNKYLAHSLAHQSAINTRLKALGKKLSWTAQTTRRGALPSVAFIAKKSGLGSLYDYLYHATSRYVHFSGVELLRRAWGRPGDISILSDNFNNYWSAFALVWGLRIFVYTYLELNDKLVEDGVIDPDVGDGEEIIKQFLEIAEFGDVPIITAQELQWKY